MHAHGSISVSTSRQMEFIDITAIIQREIKSSGLKDGICIIYNPHTTAGITINEGADPAVQDDLLAALQSMVPQLQYQHLEGNSPAHLLTSLMGSSATIFIEGGRLQLGTWQKIFFCEFDGPRSRKVKWQLQG